MRQIAPKHRPHILVVEDDGPARLSLKRMLERGGYAVTAVADGELAVERMAAESFDAVVTDLLLNGIDGVAVLAAARQVPEPPEVILLTGYATLQTAIEALRGGAYDYLLKPCKPAVLLDRVASAVARRAETLRYEAALRATSLGDAAVHREPPAEDHIMSYDHPTTPLRLGTLQIDQAQRSVTSDGSPVHLTITEYALLVGLAVAGGGIVTYSELVQLAYGIDVANSAAHQLIRTHIHNLRRKIEPALIANVRSRGYRLIPTPGSGP